MPENQTELTKEQILECLHQHKDVLRKKFSVIKIGLFGSYANNTYDTGSDIDIYVKFSNTNFRNVAGAWVYICLLYTSPSPRDRQKSRMPSSA